MIATGERPRILLMTETYWPEIGGGERQARLLAHGLARRGHEVTIVARRSRRALPRRETDGTVRLLRLPPAGPGRRRKWAFALPVLGLLLRRWRRYDLVFVSGFRVLGIPAVLARAATGKPTLLKADSSGELSGEYFRAGLASEGVALESWPVRQFVRARNALLRRADGFVALSAEMAQEFLEHAIPAERIHRIGNGVDTDIFRPVSAGEQADLRRELALPGGLLVIYTGRLVTYKGLPLLLQAWREICAGGMEATLVLVGAGSGDIQACERELRDFVAAHDLGARVRFAGASDKVSDWLRAADIFVFPTQNEAFGLSLAEAMACGLPAVTTTVGGLRDFVVHDRNALAVPPDDAAALVAALQSLLLDGERRRRLGQAARQTAIERFGTEAISDAYAALFDRVMPSSTRAGSS